MSSVKVTHPWITYPIRKQMRIRDRAHKRMKKTKSPELIKKVKDLNRTIQKNVRRAHWDYVNSLFSSHTEDPDPQQKNKRFWSYIRQQKASNVGVPPLKDDGQLFTKAKDKAEILNRQFNSAFSEGKQYSTEEIEHKCKLPDLKAPPIDDIKVNKDGIEKLLLNLDPSKAPGPDGIPPRVLNALPSEISPILTTIFTRSLSTGVVPSAWRSANVTPVYKKGEHYKASNYRPISLTSICCKVLEHVLVSNIMAHWEKYNVLVPNQHGFRGKRSCESQLIELTDELSKNIDQGYQTDVIVLDFAKAFDRVNHSLLCEKIKSYGITGKTNEWIQSFLNERKQKVVIDGESSETINVRSGVPQGSVLGPCLFLAYINDLPDKVSSNSRLFADDTAVDRKITSTEDQMTLQRDLDSLAQWENQWDMAFHPDKCEVLQVTSKRDKLSHT